MNRYEPTQPRIAFGFAAMIMAAITIGLLVVLPSKMEPESQEFAMLTAVSSAATTWGRGMLGLSDNSRTNPHQARSLLR